MALAAESPPGLLQKAFEANLSRLIAGLFPERMAAVILLHLDSGGVAASLGLPFFLESARPWGSLIKPFAALAYLASHAAAELPKAICPPAVNGREGEGCWYLPGHGALTFEQALAHSCNHYFHRLAQDIPPEDFLRTLVSFNIVEQEESLSMASLPDDQLHKAMTGYGRLPASLPIRMAHAYLVLFNRGLLFRSGQIDGPNRASRRIYLEPSAIAAIWRGMRLSSLEGTGRQARQGSFPIYTKTGTHSRKPGSHNPSHLEGWCVAVDTDVSAGVLALAYVYPGRGATEAAPLAGIALTTYRRCLAPQIQ